MPLEGGMKRASNRLLNQVAPVNRLLLVGGHGTGSLLNSARLVCGVLMYFFHFLEF